MPDYFDDISFRIVLHRFITYSMPAPLQAETNSLEFINSGRIFLEKSHKRLELIAPVAFWIEAGSLFQFILPPQETKVEHLYLDFTGERSQKMLASLNERFPDGFFTPKSPANMENTFLIMQKLYRISPHDNHPQLASLAEAILAMAYAPDITTRDDDIYQLDTLAETLRGDPFANYDFPQLAKQNGITIDHFRRLFTQKFQRTPQQYLHHQRMLRAAELLRNTNMRIKEIEYTCNFRNAIDFSRTFKAFSGLSPRDYRDTYRKANAADNRFGKL